MFMATVSKRLSPGSEKMSHLMKLITGKTKFAIAGMRFSGQIYPAAWNIIKRTFGRARVIDS